METALFLFHDLPLHDFPEGPREQVIVERTGHYGRALEQFLHERGITIYEVHPQEHTSRNKSDKRDAQMLAALLYNQVERGVLVTDENQIARRLVPPHETVQLLQGLVQHRLELVRESTQRKNKLTAIADELFPELTQVNSDPNSQSALALRKQYPSPQDIEKAALDALCETRLHTRPSRAHLAELQDLARTTIGTKHPSRRTSLLLEQKQLIAELHLLQEHLDVLEEEIETALHESRDGRILLSFPTIGTTQASIILAHMGNVANYPRASKLRGYMGWSPHQRQTGTSTDSMTLTKGGNPLLKQTMFLVSLTAIRTDTQWRTLYHRLVPRICQFDERTGRYKGRMKVIGRIAGPMIGLIYVLLRKDYDLLAALAEGEDPPEPEVYERSKHRVRGS